MNWGASLTLNEFKISSWIWLIFKWDLVFDPSITMKSTKFALLYPFSLLISPCNTTVCFCHLIDTLLICQLTDHACEILAQKYCSACKGEGNEKTWTLGWPSHPTQVILMDLRVPSGEHVLYRNIMACFVPIDCYAECSRLMYLCYQHL